MSTGSVIYPRKGITTVPALITDAGDQVARLEKSGASGSLSRGVLREMCSVLGELDQETLSLYFEVILDVFPKLPATHSSVHVPTYHGISQRVRSNYSVRAILAVRDALVA